MGLGSKVAGESSLLICICERLKIKFYAQIIQYQFLQMLPMSYVYCPLPAPFHPYPQIHYQLLYFAESTPYYLPSQVSNSDSQGKVEMGSQVLAKREPLQDFSLEEGPLQGSRGPESKQASLDSAETRKRLEQPGGKAEAKQKYGRNVLSNIFLTMVRFVQKSKKLRLNVEKVIQSNSMTIKINEFYNIIKRRAAKLRAYANEHTIAAFWRDPAHSSEGAKGVKEAEFAKLFRIMGRIYLEGYHLPYVYNTNKIKSQSKKLHISHIRKIIQL